ncbi:serine/threonine-protein kinase [Streptomyces sp. NPDC019396]|uniref:serine/threonine-protein kinase n=1 Tax=Streptomyces sp. NPDC019396 TaxID=3154687 RepID=UPI0033C80F0F
MDALKPQDPPVIGTHTLLARLGAGGMGQVYLGRSPGGRLVAIKVIKDEIVDHPEALARFRREAETVRAVRSAYTANLIDASLETTPYWLATEYVSGPTLSRAVAERGAFPADSARRLLAALAEALASVHTSGVTHRDLKPQNVILSPQGPQLIDFGIAKGAMDAALTATGVAPGTPGFTAPEVLMRNEVGSAADVFALGATIAYAATGRPPFGHGEMATVSYRAVHGDIDVDGVESALAGLIRACVAKDPAQRPGAAEVIERCAVDKALVEDDFYAPLAGLAQPALPASPQRARPGTIPAVGAPEGVHELPTAAPGYVPTYMPTQVPGPANTRRPGLRPALVTGAALLVAAGAVGGYLALDDQGGWSSSHARAGRTPSAQQSSGDRPSGTPASAAPGATGTAPDRIEPKEPSRDFWTSDGNTGEGSCNLPVQERSLFLLSGAKPVGGGKTEVSVFLKQHHTEQLPYYVSVAVKPPHEIDPEAGEPYKDLMAANLSIGYTSKPVDLGSMAKAGEELTLTYPDDFASHITDSTGTRQTDPAIPLAKDPGDWTVQVLHVRGVRDYASVACTGFAVKP